MNKAEEFNIRSIIANNIIRLMELNNKSRRQLCEDLDIKYTTFCDWVNGKTSPKPESLELLGYYFGVDIGTFFVVVDTISDSTDRLLKYSSIMKEISMDSIGKMSNDDIKKLLADGYRFKHKTLEERISESGMKLEVYNNEIEGMLPVGREVW